MAEAYSPPEGAILHNATLFLDDRDIPSVVHLVQYDNGLQIIAATLKSGSQPYAVPENFSVRIRVGKPDGRKVYRDASGFSGDRTTVYFQTSEQMTAAEGYANAIVELANMDTVVGTAKMVLVIDKNPVSREDIQSTDEYQSIEQAISAARGYAEAAAQSAASAEGSAGAADEKLQETTQLAANAAGSASTAATSAEEASASQTSAGASAQAAAENAALAAEKALAADAAAENAEGDADRAEQAADRAQSIGQGALGYYPTESDLRSAHETGENGQWAIIGETDTIWVWDSDSSSWTDSGNKTDLSKYYTKDEADQQLGELQTALGQRITEQEQKTAAAQSTADAAQSTADAANTAAAAADGKAAAAQTAAADAASHTWTLTVTAEGWTGDDAAGYTQTVDVPGMTAAVQLAGYLLPALVGSEDLEQKRAIRTAMSSISELSTGENSVTLTCYEAKPEQTLTLIVTEVR